MKKKKINSGGAKKGEGGGGICPVLHPGGSLPLEAVPDAREKKRVKRVSKSGVGTERAEREKGVKTAKNGRIGYPNRYDQNSSRAIKRGKGR